MTLPAIVLIAVAVMLVRAGWGGRRWAAPAGWALAVAMLGWLAWQDGAWGLSVGLVAGSFAAFAAVLHAGAVSPRRPARRATAPSLALADGGSRHLGRRLAVFALVVPVSFVAAQWLALGVNMAMRGGAPLEADSVATMMFVQPLAWTALMAWQMTLAGPRQMLMPPALAAVAGALLWWAA